MCLRLMKVIGKYCKSGCKNDTKFPLEKKEDGKLYMKRKEAAVLRNEYSSLFLQILGIKELYFRLIWKVCRNKSSGFKWIFHICGNSLIGKSCKAF